MNEDKIMTVARNTALVSASIVLAVASIVLITRSRNQPTPSPTPIVSENLPTNPAIACLYNYDTCCCDAQTGAWINSEGKPADSPNNQGEKVPMFCASFTIDFCPEWWDWNAVPISRVTPD